MVQKLTRPIKQWSQWTSRVAMIPFYKEIDAKSVNMNSSFKIGDYFSKEIINS